MTFDVAVIGAPFLDLTFAGLPDLPAPGEEVLAADLLAAPGGTGMQAVATARLGLRTVLISPIARDAAARVLGELFDAEGVTWAGPAAGRTPVTAILQGGDAVAMATFDPSDELSPGDVASVEADAAIVSLGRLPLCPPGAPAYVVTGPGELGRFTASGLASIGDSARAVIVNEREARSLTGAGHAAAAAQVLAEHAPAAVVTCGAAGAVAASAGALVRVPAPAVTVLDATGAGDVFAATYVWADRAGLDLETRVGWATLAASLSTTAPTAFDGALPLEDLLSEGRREGLASPTRSR